MEKYFRFPVQHLDVMIKIMSFFIFFLFAHYLSAQITLTHNIGNTLIDTGMPSCEEDESWAKVFNLSDFGIAISDQFIIRSAEVGISKSYNGAYLGLTVYRIDSNFPNSAPVPLGGGGYGLLPNIDTPQVVQINLVNPIVVPAGVERILVEVGKSVDFYNPNSAEVIIAGTEFDNDTSWYKGCRQYYTHIATTDLNTPVPNANFYINVTGEIFNVSNLGSTTTLTHNLCDDIIKTINNSCSYSYIYTGRDFYLENFGISENEEFIITEGQVAYSYAEWGAAVQFNIYEIDDDFPNSFSELDLIGSSQLHDLAYFNTYGAIKIENVEFENPIVVPAGTKRILVEVFKGLLGGGSGLLHIAGTKVDDGSPTWYKGCLAGLNYINSDEMTTYSLWPGKDYNFYINVTGNVNHITNNFEMNIFNICAEFLKEFSIVDKANVASVEWDFGDLASGTDNTSTDLSPFHDFSVDGIYTVIATVTGKDGSVEILTETIDVKEPPNAYGINNLYACEDSSDSGISTSFDTSTVEQQVLGGQTDKVVKYIDGSGSEYDVLPNPFANTIPNRETIYVRVSHSDQPCCYSETSFDLIINPLPYFTSVIDLYVCDDDSNGIGTFNLEDKRISIIGGSTNIDVEFYYENGQLVPTPYNVVNNQIANEENITVRAINTITNCYNETTFKLVVNPLPIANPLVELIGCDDNNDGISEYFDTSQIEISVLGNQSGMQVSYYDSYGIPLSSPLPNPFTNSITYQETITVRVTNPSTGCYSETPLVMKTLTKPQINQPESLFTCDEGNGFGNFDTSNIENLLIGNQAGLNILYYDENGSSLPSPLPVSFKNTLPWSQTINVKVENTLNNLCFSETSFDLVVNELPEVELEDTYFICNLEPYLSVEVDPNFDLYEWQYQDGTVISNTFEANLIDAGNYALKVNQFSNGIFCENTFDFELVRSVLPTIVNVNYQELSDNNYIEIVSSGDGAFEYSIDGLNYQDSNLFNNVLGGIYTVSVRDKFGCGEDFQQVRIVDYPKFFTPNGDGFNDKWQIRGVTDYPNAIIYIYDRYGKLLKQINPYDSGWDGTFNGGNLPASDYWFTAYLTDGREFSGHFTLKR